jgi:hypothetical protein
MSLRDVLKKRAEEAGNPNANVQVQNVAATEASKDAQPNVGDTIQTGLLSGSEIGQDAGPQEVVMLVPDEEKLAKAETCYEAVRALPLLRCQMDLNSILIMVTTTFQKKLQKRLILKPT